MFVTTCSEKSAVADRIGAEFAHIEPSIDALRIFDAGVGDGTVLSQVMRHLHREFTHVPWVVVGKEISMEDVRLSLEKLPDRFFEHPELVMVMTNLYYREAPSLYPRSAKNASMLHWHEVALEGNTAHDFDQQIRSLHDLLSDNWQVRTSEKTGNPLYVHPTVLVLYRKDREFGLRPLLPKPEKFDPQYNLVIASQPYRARASAQAKVKNVLAPLARALAPGGRMITIQSHGRDPGMELINAIWPDEAPFQTPRDQLLGLVKDTLGEPLDSEFEFQAFDDYRSLFRYRLHTMPSEVGSSIGTSTLLAAWNAAVYVAQIDDARFEAALNDGRYLAAARDVVHKYGGLWFNDESFVISRRKDAKN